MIKRYTSAKDELALFMKQEGRCKSCPAKISKSAAPHTRAYRIDHIQPLSRGGEDTIENKQLLCTKCHDKKTFHPRSKATTLGGDLYEARKTERLRAGKKKAKKAWPKRKLNRLRRIPSVNS